MAMTNQTPGGNLLLFEGVCIKPASTKHSTYPGPEQIPRRNARRMRSSAVHTDQPQVRHRPKYDNTPEF